MKTTILLLSLASIASGCSATLDLQPEEFLPSRLPTDPNLEVKNDTYSSVTSGFEPRREVEPEPWSGSNDVPSRTGGGN